MDKILRNVIIFAAVILVTAATFVIVAISGSKPVTSSVTSINDSNVATGEVQNVKLSVSGAKYILTPSTLKQGIPVRMEADLSTVRGCSRDVVISAFGVRKYVKEGDNIITFTPTKSGTINIACSMNMYRGTFTVTDTSADSGTAIAATNAQGLSTTNIPVQADTQEVISGTTNVASTHICGTSGGGCGCGTSGGGCGCGG